MQNFNESTAANKREKTLKAAILLAIICLFTFIFGLTTTNIGKNNNTSLFNSNEYYSDAHFKRLLTDGVKTADNGNVYVKIGGKPIGISVNTGGLIVIGQSEVFTESGVIKPTEGKNIKNGDVILSVAGEDVDSIYRLKQILENTDEKDVSLWINRDGIMFTVDITPAVDRMTGQKKLGLMLKEDVGGVGTLTFVTQDGRFGALGHYIADAESGLSYELNSGNIYSTSVEGVIKGEKGKAGGLIADVNRLSDPIGTIMANSDIGIFGAYTEPYDGELYRVATKGEAKIGAAKVFTTIEGSEPKFYDIDIVKVVSQSVAGEKGMVIAVRDKELLEKTGGIVQGMSGSPIVQDGVLIGAVTHVFVQDPTRGYAVHSRFMYDYAMSLREAAQARLAA